MEKSKKYLLYTLSLILVVIIFYIAYYNYFSPGKIKHDDLHSQDIQNGTPSYQTNAKDGQQEESSKRAWTQKMSHVWSKVKEQINQFTHDSENDFISEDVQNLNIIDDISNTMDQPYYPIRNDSDKKEGEILRGQGWMIASRGNVNHDQGQFEKDYLINQGNIEGFLQMKNAYINRLQKSLQTQNDLNNYYYNNQNPTFYSSFHAPEGIHYSEFGSIIPIEGQSNATLNMPSFQVMNPDWQNILVNSSSQELLYGNHPNYQFQYGPYYGNSLQQMEKIPSYDITGESIMNTCIQSTMIDPWTYHP